MPRSPEGTPRRAAAEAADTIDVVQVGSRAELLEVLPGTRYLVGFPLTEEQVAERGGSLRWVQLTGSGDSPGALRAVVERGGRVTTAARVRAPQVAEHAIALTLALFRGLHLAASAQAEHRWAAGRIGSLVRSLSESTVGLVSFGPVGEEIAQRLKSFGVTVLATRRDPSNPFINVDEMFPLESLHAMLARSDAVIVAAPRIALTEGMMGRKQINAMRDDAFLVNVSRGGIVDQAALIDALRRGRLAGAALDSFETEPLPPNSPFWTMANVLVTPHIASASPTYWERATDLVCTNVRRLLADEPLVDELPPQWLSAAG